MSATDWLIAVPFIALCALAVLSVLGLIAWAIDQRHARRDERDGWDPRIDVLRDEFGA